MSLLGKKELMEFDTVVLYVTTCSDVDVSFKNSRRFLEARVTKKIPELGDDDARYLVRCAEDLRKDIYKTGLFPSEAMVSEYSPFLMSVEFFNTLKENSDVREQWLKEVEEMIMGEVVPEGLEHWQNEVNAIIQALGTDVHDVISDIKSDFSDGKMELIKLK